MDVDFPHVLIVLLVLGALALWIGAFVSIGASKVRGGEKAIWVLVVLLFPFVGSIAWLLIGRRTDGGADVPRL
ncbi:MAG: PLDc_N domain-containing protein [Microbacterium sp.]|uniref:PLD nuclease N-terminal domain-containing protein n=1 Tax=Microbacterium sp. TaxID=51671 RepID=UPI001AD0E87C|nr:PLD nuclease N-terminal domain-containing protein [Microbacterium sp.]MBN9177558.1 PLDc_N domain-containing protein [Microbacterium sp.]